MRTYLSQWVSRPYPGCEVPLYLSQWFVRGKTPVLECVPVHNMYTPEKYTQVIPEKSSYAESRRDKEKVRGKEGGVNVHIQ